jgi:hypothetical protein
MTEGKTLSANERRYARINDLWPETVPPLTEQEAVSAAKRLYRLGVGRAFKGKFKIVTGNRRTWIRGGVFVLNPSKGWKSLVHTISHLTHYKTHPGKTGHHWTHIGFERKLTEAVLKKGWLDGNLRRDEPAKPDQRTIRYQRIVTRIETWEKKKRRAETALTKLYKSKTYYERSLTQ